MVQRRLTGCVFRYDLATASDLRYYALPDAQNRLEALLAKQAEEEKSGLGGPDTVTPEQIAEIVARWTSIPVTRLMSTEKEKLLRMENILSESVVGQPEAVKAVANAIRLSRSGLGNAQRPIASFLMAGPSGTGKTLLSKTVSTDGPHDQNCSFTHDRCSLRPSCSIPRMR
jgi:ATP-dependent Clp protease ATP-binding subunit ClpA